jgi:hypothetical protein
MTADGFATREGQLREEISHHERFLSTLDDDDDFITQMIREQAQERIRFLSEELAAVTDKLLDLRFDDELHRRSMPTGLLALLLSRFQTALTYTGWALEVGPGIKGEPPARIDRSTETEVVALTAGSFLVRIRKSSLELDSGTLDNAVEAVLELAEAGARGTLNTELEEKAQLLGREPSRRLALFFRKLSESSLTTSFHWQGLPEREIEIDPVQAGNLGMWLEEVEESIREATVRGILKVADTLRGRFAIVDESGRTYEGRAEPRLLAHVEIEAEYAADLHITTSVSDRTGAATERMTLLSLSRPGEELPAPDTKSWHPADGGTTGL